MSLYTVVEDSYGEEYEVTIDYDWEEDKIIDYECECPAYAAYSGMCKHCLALSLYWLERLDKTGSVYEKPGVRTAWEIKNLIQNCVLKEHLEQQKASGEIELEPELVDQGTDYRGNRKWFLTFKIGNTRKYVLKNLPEFIEHIRQEEVFSYGKQLSFLHSKSAFTEKAWKYVELIGTVEAMYSNSHESLRKELPLNNRTLEAFLMMNLNQEIPYDAYRSSSKSIHILDRDPKWKPKLRSEGKGKGCVLQLPPPDYIEGTQEWFVKNGNQIYRCGDEFGGVLDIVQAYFPDTDQRHGLFYFLSKDEERFYQLLSTGLGQMDEIGKVYAAERIKGRKLLPSPGTKVGVAVKGGLLELSLETEGLSRKELLGVLDSYRKKKKFYRLKSGDFLSLEDSSVGTVAELLTGLNLKQGELKQEVLEVPAFCACYIDRILQEKREQIRVERSSDYKAIIRNMKNVEDSDYTVPKGLERILREIRR